MFTLVRHRCGAIQRMHAYVYFGFCEQPAVKWCNCFIQRNYEIAYTIRNQPMHRSLHITLAPASGYVALFAFRVQPIYVYIFTTHKFSTRHKIKG